MSKTEIPYSQTSRKYRHLTGHYFTLIQRFEIVKSGPTTGLWRRNTFQASPVSSPRRREKTNARMKTISRVGRRNPYTRALYNVISVWNGTEAHVPGKSRGHPVLRFLALFLSLSLSLLRYFSRHFAELRDAVSSIFPSTDPKNGRPFTLTRVGNGHRARSPRAQTSP